jgi:DNA-binding transcriptional MerR regulator
MDILKLLKQGVSVEDISEMLMDDLEAAVAQYDRYLEEQERKAKEEAARKMEEEFRKKKAADARQALGAAMINYFESLGMEVTEKTMSDVDLLIDMLPKIKVWKSWR